MWYGNRKSRSRWQKAYIADVFSHKTGTQRTFSAIILGNPDLLKDKHTHMPRSLFRFFAPTPENLADLRNRRLWLSHPRTFNDPFDCQAGYDIPGYEKHALLDHIGTTGCVEPSQSSDGLTTEELKRLSSARTEYNWNWHEKIEEYDTVLRKVMEGKSKKFVEHVQAFTSDARAKAEEIVEQLRQVDIRVACFSALKHPREFDGVVDMWSHYAANHRGFCVECDMAPLAKPFMFTLGDHEFYGDRRDEYCEERLRALILAGLFPVIYGEGRANVPKTKLQSLIRKRDTRSDRDPAIEALLYKTYICKSGRWSHEKEWRLIVDGDISRYYGNRIPFPYAKRMYIGCRMEKQAVDDAIDVCEELGVEVRLMVMDNRKFLLDDHSIDLYKWQRESTRARNPFW